MATVSGDLIWELTKNNSSFLKRTKKNGGADFNVAPTNPLALNKKKYAAGANKSTSVTVTKNGDLVIKKADSANIRKPSQYTTKVKNTKGHRSVTKYAQLVVEATEGEDFRPDLKRALVVRAARLLKLKQLSKRTQKK
ncbi:hypothetical protein ABK040_016546 [Willaertia magna]